MENYEFAVLTKPKDVQPWWLRYSLVLFQQQQDIKAMEIMRKVAGRYPRVEEIKVALASKSFHLSLSPPPPILLLSFVLHIHPSISSIHPPTHLPALVYAYGDKNEAERMWSELNGAAQYKYRDEDFLRYVCQPIHPPTCPSNHSPTHPPTHLPTQSREKLRWPDRMLKTLKDFKGLYTPPRAART